MALRSPQPGDLNLISICTGGGGLDRAVELAIPAARPVVCVEREAFAVASLVAQIEDGLMAPAAVWSDVRTFDGRPWRGLVDGLIGGIPCQPHSLAGRRGGSTDERDLWSPTRRIIAQARPWFVLIENVGGMLSAGADEIPGAYRVRRDLRKLGYEVEGGLFRASDVGLPHERERIFILGVADPGGQRRQTRSAHRHEGPDERRPPSDDHVPQCGGAVVHPFSRGRDGRPEGAERGPQQRAAEQLAGAIPDEQRLPDPDGAEPAAQCRDAERGGEHLGDAASVGRGEGWSEPELRGGRQAAELANAHGERLQGLGPDASASGREDAGRPAGLRDRAVLADADLAELRGQPPAGEQPLLQRDHGAGERPFLCPPGPGDTDAWRSIAECAPRLLPAVSRYDLFRLEMGAQGFAPDGDPSTGSWVDPQTGARPHPAQLQAAAQSAIRGVADVLATRIDELRMLGNGVADAQGALAVRTLVHELAPRSAGAALLVRMMEDSE